MREPDSTGPSKTAATEPGELERFRRIKRLHNHWSRPIGPRAYYWYLTFEQSPGLHSLATECQKATAFPYYDLVPMRDLHLTLDRVAFEDHVTTDQLNAISAATRRACQEIPPFDITIGSLNGTAGAIGFDAFPARSIRELRDTFRSATLLAYPDAEVQDSPAQPHVTIAYANTDAIPAAEAISAVEKLNSAAPVDVTIRQATLVILEREARSYSWQAVSRVPLTGRPTGADAYTGNQL
jgi:2'-5' RNA ligase